MHSFIFGFIWTCVCIMLYKKILNIFLVFVTNVFFCYFFFLMVLWTTLLLRQVVVKWRAQVSVRAHFISLFVADIAVTTIASGLSIYIRYPRAKNNSAPFHIILESLNSLERINFCSYFTSVVRFLFVFFFQIFFLVI